MIQLDSHEHDINNKYSFAEFRDILDSYEKRGATHLQLSYEDYGNPIINLFEETEVEQQQIPITYATIQRRIGWSRFAEETNRNVYAINEFGDYPPNEVFYITEEQAKKLNL